MDQFFLLPFLISLVLTFCVVRFSSIHIKFSSDSIKGPQKIHRHNVPRIGGGIIFLVFLIYAYLFRPIFLDFNPKYFIVAAIPVFLGGITEDITKKVSVTSRLILSFSSSILGYFLYGAIINRTGLVIFDDLLLILPELSILFTLIAVGGLCHSINIIDGMNGIILGYAIIILFFLFYSANEIRFYQLSIICLIFMGGSMGVLIFNFPFGKIFSGDGGSYLLGFVIAEVSILLVAKSQTISAFFPVALLFYPIIETTFTVVRRIYTKKNPFLPDSLHLHSLLYKFLQQKFPIKNDNLQNALVAPIIWCWSLINGFVLIHFLPWTHNHLFVFGVNCLIYLSLYISLYKRTNK